MSMLPAEVHAELAQLLQALQSPDNNIRSQAEDHLQNNWTASRPEVLLMGLAEQISGSTDAPVGHGSFSPLCCFVPPPRYNLTLETSRYDLSPLSSSEE